MSTGYEHIDTRRTGIGRAVRSTCDEHPGWYVKTNERGGVLDAAIDAHLDNEHCAECQHAFGRGGLSDCGTCIHLLELEDGDRRGAELKEAVL